MRLVLSFFLCFGILQAEEAKLTVLTINDVYDILPMGGYGGIPELATMLKHERGKAEHYLTTVNGDFLSPSLISGVFLGSQMIDLMNMLEVDVVVFGNHEFDFGTEVLKERMKESNFCWLGSNVLNLSNGMPFSKAHSSVIFDVDGIKVGMIGLCTTETFIQNQPDIAFTPIILSAQAAVHRLKNEGADVIIALTHLSYDEDCQLAFQVPEIDVILGGHDHDPMTLFYNNKTLIHKSGRDAQYLGRIDLQIEKKMIDGKLKVTVFPTWKMISNHGFEKDPAMAERAFYYASKIDEEMSQCVAICDSVLDSTNVRFQETTMGNLIADALKSRFKADIALINAGAIRGNRTYSVGTALTKKDIQTELPFGNIAVLVEITGEQLFSIMEKCLSRIEQKSGNFPQVSGMRVVYNSENAAGGRISELSINGEMLEKKKTYRLATNDFLMRGGDGVVGMTNAKVLISPGVGPLLTGVVVDYMREMGTVGLGADSRIIDCSFGSNTLQGVSSGKRIHFN